MKRLVYYLRDLVWTSILSTTFLILAMLALFSGDFALAQAVALIGIGLAILSVRS